MATVLLATFQLMPDGEPDGDLLVSALADRGIDASWVCWDDADVEWEAADLVAVRSTWDYSRRREEFLAWARRLELGTNLLNGADLIAWNSDKSYLLELADRVPTVPSVRLDDGSLVGGITEALTKWGAAVIKPCVGAGGIGVQIVEDPRDPRLIGLTRAPWLIQPLLSSVRTEGERSVFVFDGHATSQVNKVPASGGLLVHQEYGGVFRPVAVQPELGEIAEAAVAAAAALVGPQPAYARVDLMQHEDQWCVSELEMIEPSLYFDVDPSGIDRYADLLAAHLP